MIATLFVVLLLIMTDNRALICFAPTDQAELVQDNLVATMISKMNTIEIYNTVYTLQNFKTRAYGYSGNVEAASYLYNRLSNISGLSVEYQGDYRNIVATLPGVDPTSNATYIVGAHYDSFSSNLSDSPGATDDGGGVAIVLEFARIMSQYSFNRTLKFVFWNCEENGELGSTQYVKYAYNNKINISLYMNFDSSCYDPYNRMTLDIMSNNQSSWVSDMMTEYNTLYGINLTLNYNIHTCSSDHIPFWAYGYTALMTHQEVHGPEHTSDDTIDKVSTSYAEKNGQLGMSVLATLAEVQDINAHSTPTPSPLTTPVPTSTAIPSSTPAPTPDPTETLMPQSPNPSPSQSPYSTLVPAASSTPIRTPTATSSPKSVASQNPTQTLSQTLPQEVICEISVTPIVMVIALVALIVKKRIKARAKT